ncbi:hypothetical protein SAMN02745866_03945 [Alteromonadaceae bacterium Bs31]|nr:hypothetical protein SAMN02745866_03945 [Alteromonadaceae bacterium Bs31]
MTIKQIQVLAVATLLFFSSGTIAKKPDNSYSDKLSPFPLGSSILVLPINTNQLLQGMEKKDIEVEMFKQLKATGAVPKKGNITNSEDRFDYFLLTSVRAFGDPKVDLAKQKFVSGVAGSFDLVIIPSVYETQGFMDGEFISFDGARIRVSSVEGRTGNWRGSQRGLSLRYEVYSNDGAWLMTLQGGIAMPRIATFATKEFNRKEYLFKKSYDRKYLAKGVKIVTKPLKKKLKFK